MICRAMVAVPVLLLVSIRLSLSVLHAVRRLSGAVSVRLLRIIIHAESAGLSDPDVVMFYG